jgi:hypothetical protein
MIGMNNFLSPPDGDGEVDDPAGWLAPGLELGLDALPPPPPDPQALTTSANANNTMAGTPNLFMGFIPFPLSGFI